MSKTTYIALIVLGILVGATIAYAIQYLQIPTTGTIQTPPTLTATPSSLNWGEFNQTTGPTKNLTFTLTNIGDEATYPLILSLTWLNPQTPIGTVTWNGTASIINGHETKLYWIALTITNTTYIGDFSFNINIGA